MKSEKKRAGEWFEWYDALVTALAAVVVIFLFGVRVVTVSGSSMEPTLASGESVLVQTLTGGIERGDIVVADSYTSYGDPIIKRVIGTGGDVIDIDFATGTVTRNGEVLQEAYISAPTTTGYDVAFPLTVPQGQVFLMGDNRPRSKDSRSSEIGCVDERALLGKVVLRIRPLERFGAIS